MLEGTASRRRRLSKSELRSVQGEGERRLIRAIEMAKAKMERRRSEAGAQTGVGTVKTPSTALAAPRIKEFEAFLLRITQKNGKG